MIKNKSGLMFLVNLHKLPRLLNFPPIVTPKVNSFSFKYSLFTAILAFQIQNQRSNYFMSHGTHLHGAAETLQSTTINIAVHVVHIASIWLVFPGSTQIFMQIYIMVGFKKQRVLRVPFSLQQVNLAGISKDVSQKWKSTKQRKHLFQLSACLIFSVSSNTN